MIDVAEDNLCPYCGSPNLVIGIGKVDKSDLKKTRTSGKCADCGQPLPRGTSEPIEKREETAPSSPGYIPTGPFKFNKNIFYMLYYTSDSTNPKEGV